MKNKDIRFSIRNKLIILFVIIGFIPILSLIIFINNIKSNTNIDSIIKNIQSTNRAIIEIIDKSVENIIEEESLNIENKLVYLSKLPYILECSKKQPKDSNGVWLSFEGRENIYIKIDTEFLIDILKKSDDYEKIIYIKETNNNKDKIVKELNEKYEETSIVAYSTLFDNRVFIAEILDRDILFKEAIILVEIIIKSIMIIMILSICLACIFSYKISYDIDKLVKAMKSIENGNFNTNLKVKSNDEIGLLAKQFMKMSNNLNILINKTLKLKISEREAKIKALQAQISPHFLYNALDLINWRLINNEDYDTSNILICLSSMLRYSIDDSRSMVGLQEELNQVENYLNIQSERFENRFIYNINIEESIKAFNIPKMIIQPLVENSINHGVENLSNGYIKIDVYKEVEGIYISVYDTGNGMSKDRVEYVKNKIKEYDQIIDDKDVHIGLCNVNNRLKYVFGKKSGVIIDSVEGKYTRVLLKIQLERDYDEGINC